MEQLDFHKMSTKDRATYLREKIPNVCIDEHSKDGHINAMFWLYLLATDESIDAVIRQVAERIFDKVEDGNYDVSMDTEVILQENRELRAANNVAIDRYAATGD